MDDIQKEYKSILDLLNKDVTKNDIYSELMNKEDNILNTVNRLSNTNLSSSIQDTLFYNKTLLEILSLFANTWTNILTELVNEDMYMYPMKVFWDGDRKIFVGLMMVIIALFLFFIQISA